MLGRWLGLPSTPMNRMIEDAATSPHTHVLKGGRIIADSDNMEA